MAEGRSPYSFREFKTPMDKGYHAELEDSPPLDAEYHTRYRAMIGSLNWAVTLGRFDIQYVKRICD